MQEEWGEVEDDEWEEVEELGERFSEILQSVWDPAQDGRTDSLRKVLNALRDDSEWQPYKVVVLQRAMWVAARNDHVEVLRLLLENGAEVDSENRDGLTPLWVSSFTGSAEAAGILVQAKALVDGHYPPPPSPYLAGPHRCFPARYPRSQSGVHYGTPAHVATQGGHLCIVEMLVHGKADVHLSDYRGNTPVHYAAAIGHLEGVKFILAAKGDVNTVNWYKESPLHRAAYCNRLGVVEMLLRAKAEVNVVCWLDCSPALHAARNGHHLVVELLLRAKADVNAASDAGDTPLHDARHAGHAEVLLRAKADLNAVMDRGETPAHIVAERGDHGVFEVLLRAKADLNKFDSEGNTPAHTAAAGGRHGVFEVLLKAKADLNKGTTAETSRYRRGAYTNWELAKIPAGSTPLDVARVFGHTKVVALLTANVSSCEDRAPDTKRWKMDQ